METPPNPIDATGEEANRLGLPVPPKAAIQRYYPIEYCEGRGSYKGQVEKRANGDYVLYTDHLVAMASDAERNALKAQNARLNEDLEIKQQCVKILDDANQSKYDEIASLSEVNSELQNRLDALEQVALRLNGDIIDLVDERDQLKGIASELVATLTFYADPRKYLGPNREPESDEDSVNGVYQIDVTRDNGDRARAAIAKASV